jgi:6-phosphogluconolactonase
MRTSNEVRTVAMAASVADRVYHREGINMKSGIRNMARGASVVAALTMLSACGGGDSGPTTSATSATPAPPAPPATPAPPLTYTLGGGTVSGLMGSGLVLQLLTTCPHCGHQLFMVLGEAQVNSNGPFTFDSVNPPDPNFAPVSVRITQQPASPTQLCVLQAATVTHVKVVCSQFSYVANAVDNTVSAYTVDATSGALAAVGSPVGTGTSPHAIVGSQDREFVFVGNEGSKDISAFAVNFASGALTPVPGSPFPAGTDPKALALYKLFGTYLYVANAASDTVSAFAVDMSTGSLTPLSPATFPTGKGPSSIAVDPTNRFIYVANNGGSNDVSAFSVDPATGILTPVAGSPFPAGANPLSVALGAGGQFLYTANPDATSPSISGFNLDANSGALTPLSGSPFPLAVSHDIATDRTGAYLYVTAGTGVVGYGIDGTTGMLSPLPGFPVVTGTDAYSVTLDLINQFLYVASDGSADVSGFRFDASTGGLTPITGSPFRAGNHPDFVAVF